MKITVEYPVLRYETKEVEISDDYRKYFNNDLYVDFDDFPCEVVNNIEDCIYTQTNWDSEKEYEILGWNTGVDKDED